MGQGLDSLVFISVAFAGTIPLAGLPPIILTQWLVKTAYEALAPPLTYGVVNYLKRQEELDVYDYDTGFSPIALGD